MPLHESPMDRPPVASEGVATDRKQTHRLYPSLPQTDRNKVSLPRRSAGEKPPAVAQSEASAAGSDVRLRAQISVLEEQRQELLSINEKWAKEYRTMKRYYSQKLRGVKAALQDGRRRLPGEAREEGEATERTEAAGADGSSELLKAEKEAKDLRAQNGSLTRRWEHQRKEIRRLNEVLQEALQAQLLDASSETLQGVWKHQAEVYKEDFLKERRDREKMHEKCLELERKLRKVHSELRVLQPQASSP